MRLSWSFSSKSKALTEFWLAKDLLHVFYFICSWRSVKLHYICNCRIQQKRKLHLSLCCLQSQILFLCWTAFEAVRYMLNWNSHSMYLKQCECTWCTYIFNMYVYYSEFWSNQKNKRKQFTNLEKSLLHVIRMFVIQMIFEFFHGVVLSRDHTNPTQEIQMIFRKLGPRMDNVEM